MPDRFFPEPLLLKPPSWCPVTLCHSPCVVSHTLAPLVCDRGHPHSHALPSPSPTSYSLPPSLLPSSLLCILFLAPFLAYLPLPPPLLLVSYSPSLPLIYCVLALFKDVTYGGMVKSLIGDFKQCFACTVWGSIYKHGLLKTCKTVCYLRTWSSVLAQCMCMCTVSGVYTRMGDRWLLKTRSRQSIWKHSLMETRSTVLVYTGSVCKAVTSVVWNSVSLLQCVIDHRACRSILLLCKLFNCANCCITSVPCM